MYLVFTQVSYNCCITAFWNVIPSLWNLREVSWNEWNEVYAVLLLSSLHIITFVHCASINVRFIMLTCFIYIVFILFNIYIKYLIVRINLKYILKIMSGNISVLQNMSIAFYTEIYTC